MTIQIFTLFNFVLTLVMTFLGLLVLWGAYELGFASLTVYAFLWVVIFWLSRPEQLLSPLSVIHIYYLVFFVGAPAFAVNHKTDNFASSPFYLAYGMIFLTHAAAACGALLGERTGLRSPLMPVLGLTSNPDAQQRLLKVVIMLFILSTVLVWGIVQVSGGLTYWIEAPGDAFLNRAGSGIFVVMSHLTTFCLASLVGYYTYITERRLPLIIFFCWLLITSPVHGSKMLISLFLILSLTPWLRSWRVVSLSAVLFGLILLGIFFFGLFLRNISWMSPEDAIPYALNYFTALRNLVMLLNDFDPGFVQTFFLPFNKFLTPFGLSDLTLYYDMNHLLTDKYFPEAWKIRATEQWPVEADLYLNFYFIFGLPLPFIYTYLIGYFYGRAKVMNNLGSWVLAMLLVVSITSHLRGSIYNHVDFYLYPMFFIIYHLLKKYSLKDSINIMQEKIT